jgi:hypothetical protein
MGWIERIQQKLNFIACFTQINHCGHIATLNCLPYTIVVGAVPLRPSTKA